MKYNAIFTAFLLSSILLISSCKNGDSKKTSETDTNESVNNKPEAVTPDLQNYSQYVSCKIDGHPYIAYSDANNTLGVFNSMNLPSRQDFSTRENQVEINGETKISQMDFSFYTLSKKSEGTLTSNTDFHVDGYTMFPEGGKLVRVSFETKDGQQLTITSFKDGILEGTFSFVDNADPAKIVKVTDGIFKFKMEGKTNLQYDKNGDVNMDSLLKSLN